MIYASIDIETTGLNWDTCQILEIGMYIEDTTKKLPREKLPYFHCGIIHDFIKGEPYALNMHLKNGLLQRAIDRALHKPVDGSWLNLENVYTCLLNSFTSAFTNYRGCEPGEKITVAGKNFNGFDKNFFIKLDPKFKNLFHHRTIDPAQNYYDEKIDGDTLPDLATCKKRAGLVDVVSHTALDDAWDVIQLLRFKNF